MDKNPHRDAEQNCGTEGDGTKYTWVSAPIPFSVVIGHRRAPTYEGNSYISTYGSAYEKTVKK
jgi:hypothetical protein